MNQVAFFCINYQNEVRKNKMLERFRKLDENVTLHFVAPVFENDDRLTTHPEHDKIGDKRTWAIMLQHLDSIRAFLENEDHNDKEFAIICEDDIFLSRDFKKELPNVLQTYKELQLNVLLLGYLMDFLMRPPSGPAEKFPVLLFNGTGNCSNSEFPLWKRTENHSYYDFPYHIWGAQMYLIDRKHARFLLDKYTLQYAFEDLGRPYNPDWTLTKDGKKAIVYPMLALEEGVVNTTEWSQIDFHRRCFLAQYHEDQFF